MAYQYAGVYADSVTYTGTGIAVPNASITVYLRGTTTLATLYADETKAVQVANPTATDSEGNLTFYADPNTYTCVGPTGSFIAPVHPDPREISSGAVTSVAGRTGAVALSTTDISGLGSAATQPSSAFDASGAAAAINATLTARSLIPTATKTANYTAVAGDFVMVDATSGPITITAPACVAGARWGIRLVTASANVVTASTVAAGSVPFDTNGLTTLPMATGFALLDTTWAANAAGTQWVGTTSGKPNSYLASLFAPVSGSTSYAPVLDAANLARLNNLAAADRAKSLATSQASMTDAASIVEQWAATTAWACTSFTTALQLSANKIFSGSAPGGASGATQAWPLGTTGVGRAVFVVNHIAAAGSGGLIVGVSSDTAGSAPTAGAANAFGLYLHPSAVIQQMSSGAATSPASLTSTSPATGQYIVTVTADANYLSVVMVKTDGSVEWRIREARGRNIQCLYIFNSDNRQLSGDSIGPIGARQALVTVSPRTNIEGIARTVHWSTLPSAVSMRIALPPTYDARKPAPLAICFHGNGSDETHFADNANGLVVANALTAAGFIVASCGAGSTWGAQAALDAYYALYQYCRDNYAIGATVFYANSMGGIESLLCLAERRIPAVAAWAATSPAANLASDYVDGSAVAGSEAAAIGQAEFTATINTAYGITGAGGNTYALLTAGHDPLLKAGNLFRGVPMLMYAATDDYQVFKDQNADKLLTLVAPYSPDATVTPATGGHSFSFNSIATPIATWLSKYVTG